MEKSVVEIKNLSHKYSAQWAVQKISFNITGKGVVGLLGSNGAGKSTTMNILCGVLKQTEGDVFINGLNLRENLVEAKKHIGFLPQQPPLYQDLTVNEYLRHSASLRMIPHKEIDAAVDEVLEKCSIKKFKSRLIKNLSGGYQQRVGIAQAIIHNPKLVVFDEPTNGLDPNQIVDIRNLIREIAKTHAVLLSTHILAEAQALCNDVIMIESGKLVFSGRMEDFDNYITPQSFILEFGNSISDDELSAIAEVDRIDSLEGNRYRIFLANKDRNITHKYIEYSNTNNLDLIELRIERSSLDEIFAQLSSKNEKE